MNYAFKELLKQAIDYNQECWIGFTSDYPEVIHSVDKDSLAKEFRTVHLGTGRRSGKTRAVHELADSSSLVIVPRNAMIDLYLGQLGNNYSLCTADNFKAISRNGLTRIYIDEPALFSRSDIDVIYHRFARADGNVLFVLVGA